MIWFIFLAAIVAAYLVWKNHSNKGKREVISVIALALRENPHRAISNDYDAKRIATAWVSETPPKFRHNAIGGATIQSTAMGEALFILTSRLRQKRQPHIEYEKAATLFLLALSQGSNINAKMTALDLEIVTDAARAAFDADNEGA